MTTTRCDARCRSCSLPGDAPRVPVEDDCLKSPTTKVTFVKTCIIVRPHRSKSNKTGARNKIDRRGHYLKQVVGSQARVGAPHTDRAAMPTSGSITTAEESRPTARPEHRRT